MKILESKLRKIIKEELQLEGEKPWQQPGAPPYVNPGLQQEPRKDPGGEVLHALGMFLAKLGNEGHDELASELDKILVKFPEEWRGR